jgi:hypothetical protein
VQVWHVSCMPTAVAMHSVCGQLDVWHVSCMPTALAMRSLCGQHTHSIAAAVAADHSVNVRAVCVTDV